MVALMKKKNWSNFLTSDAERSLIETGQALASARKRRGFSISKLANKVGVDPRRISELEKGSPGVSIGIFLQILSILDLSKGFAECLNPENDIGHISQNIRKLRKNKKLHTPITDDEANF